MGLLTRNLRLKVICVLVAIVTWAGVVYAANPPETRVVSVAVPQGREVVPARYVLVHPIADIRVRISGTRSHLDAFDIHSLLVTVDYTTIESPGTATLSARVVNSDPNVVMGDTDWPHTVQADVDTLDSATVPVTVVTNPPPPFGYVVVGQATDPAGVTVTGASRELAGLQARVTLDLSNQKTNVQTDWPVLLYDPRNNKINDLAVLPPTVRVTITVTPTQVSRSSAVLPKTTGQVAAGHQLVGISVDPPTSLITGPRDLLNALDSIATLPISLNNLTADTSITIKLAPPAGVTAAPDTVTVHLTIITLAPPPTATPSPAPSPKPT